MTRRLLPIAGVLAALALSSCATFEDADTVAEAGDQRLDEDTLEDILESPVGGDLLRSLPPFGFTGPTAGVIEGDAARAMIEYWVTLHAIEESGLVDTSARADAEQDIAPQYGADWDASPESARDMALLQAMIEDAFGTGAVDREALIDAILAMDIRVDPRYGRWDPETFRVQPLS